MDSPLIEIAEALAALADERHLPPARASALTRTFAERRAHVRLRPFDLPGPVEARLKHGPLLTIIDVSPGGALLETDARLSPGAHVVLEFAAPGAQRTTMVPSCVTRSHITACDGDSGPRYRGGFAFTRPLPLEEVATPDEPDFPIEDTSALADAISGIRSVASASRDPGLAELLSEIVLQTRAGGSVSSLMAFVEQRLRRHVPLVAVTFAAKPRGSVSCGECFAFELGHTDDNLKRMHVEFKPAAQLDDAQVRLLHAGASVLSLIYSWHRPFATR